MLNEFSKYEMLTFYTKRLVLLLFLLEKKASYPIIDLYFNQEKTKKKNVIFALKFCFNSFKLENYLKLSHNK